MSLLRRALATFLAVLGIVVLGATPARAAETYIYLTAFHSSKQLVILNARQDERQPAIQWPGNGPAPDNDKMWMQKRGGTTNEFFIRPMHSNKCLAVLNNSFALYARIVQATCTNDGINDNDIWLQETVQTTKNGQTYRIPQYRSKSSRLCMAVLSASTANGAEIVQYTCNGSHNSLWTYIYEL